MEANKNTVIDALRLWFAGDPVEADLITASCENIYQWGRVQGMSEALETMRRDMVLPEEVLDDEASNGEHSS